MTAQHRVDELRLAVSAAGRSEEVRHQAERFTREVLERTGDLLESRFPGRLFLIRRLPVRWALSDEQFTDPAEMGRLAEELAETVGNLGEDHDSVVVFEDEAEWQARYLVARGKVPSRGTGLKFSQCELCSQRPRARKMLRGGASAVLQRGRWPWRVRHPSCFRPGSTGSPPDLYMHHGARESKH